MIQASGEGKRFGSNKLLVDLGGKPLCAYVLEATDCGCFPKRLVVTRWNEVAEICRKKGVEVLLHEEPLQRDTIRLGVEQMEGMEGCLFCTADQPLLRKESIQALVDAFLADPSRIYRLSFAGQGASPVIFPKAAFAALKKLPTAGGGSAVFSLFAPPVLVEALGKEELMDVDTVEDLMQLRRLLAARY